MSPSIPAPQPTIDPTARTPPTAPTTRTSFPAARSTSSGQNKKLREGRTAAETQRAIERARNEIRDQREIERIAAEVLHDGTDVWRGTDITALRDDDGLPDRGKIIAHAKTVGQLLTGTYANRPPPPHRR